MLRYCAWCGCYMGHKPGEGHQIMADRSEIDTSTICPTCRKRHLDGDKPSRSPGRG